MKPVTLTRSTEETSGGFYFGFTSRGIKRRRPDPHFREGRLACKSGFKLLHHILKPCLQANKATLVSIYEMIFKRCIMSNINHPHYKSSIHFTNTTFIDLVCFPEVNLVM